MARKQVRNFGSDWRSDERYERPERDYGRNQDYRDRDFDRSRDTNRDFNRDFSGSDRFPEDYEQRRFSTNSDRGTSGRDFNQNYSHNMSRDRDDHHRGAFGDRDYTRDYALGTGTSMRMNRYENSERGEQDRGFFGKGPKGWKRSDDRIKEEICECLYDSRYIDASEIEINVKDGHVTLSGTVDSRDAKREVESLIDSVRGIEDVQNNLKFTKNQNVSEISNRRTGTDSGKSASLS